MLQLVFGILLLVVCGIMHVIGGNIYICIGRNAYTFNSREHTYVLDRDTHAHTAVVMCVILHVISFRLVSLWMWCFNVCVCVHMCV